jgi:uncharacterized protein (TIGR02145 family)
MENAKHIIIILFAMIIFSLSCEEKNSTKPDLTNTAPIASFTVFPPRGTIQTNFEFRASQCTDKEDADKTLRVRWDWENDGIWDTIYSTVKGEMHQFPVGGIKEVLLEVIDSSGLTDSTTRRIKVLPTNTPPTAIFTVSPDSGTTETVFTFHASMSSDKEDTITALRAHWYFDRYGWEAIAPVTTTQMFQYKSIGVKNIKMEVWDSGGLTDTCATQLTVKMVGGEKGSVTDIDGNTYGTVRINNQWWMTENLKVTHYRNGDAIPDITIDNIWEHLTAGACCVLYNKEENAADCGRFYNWYAVNDKRRIAPIGWHVPSIAEWKVLIEYLGGGDIAGRKMKQAGPAHWHDWPSHDWSRDEGTDDVGFSALGCGCRVYQGSYGDKYYYAFFWSCTQNKYEPEHACNCVLTYSSPQSSCYGDVDKVYGFSVRCVAD